MEKSQPHGTFEFTPPVVAGDAFDYQAETIADKIERETDSDFREQLVLARDVAKEVAARGGLALVVGGYARDEVLRRFGNTLTSKDIDLEIYGIEFTDLHALLDDLGTHKPDVVGEAFGVLKFGGLDISIPRRDSKTGVGHKGFRIEGDPHMSVSEAARRRDFTINALALNPLTGQIIDEYGGVDDARRGILRATDLGLFADDPLRALRAMQFAARFDFEIDPTTVELCRTLNLKELAKERIGEEWNKLLTKAVRPSRGLEAAKELGVLEQLHPELAILDGVPQEAEWHPEGDVWTHTKMVVDAAQDICDREGLRGHDRYLIMLGALCHDLGKPATTRFDEQKGRITSRAHEPAGVEPTERFLVSIHVSAKDRKMVTALVREHLYPAMNPDASDAAIRRLSNRLHPATIHQLVLVAEADHRGRDIPWDGFPQGTRLRAKAEQLAVIDNQPKPLILGRHLIECGKTPGPEFSQLLRYLYDAQLDGAFQTEEEAREYLRNYLT